MEVWIVLERVDYLIRLLKCSTGVTFTVPLVFFNETLYPQDKFEEMRRAYNILKKDDTLEILEVPLLKDEKMEITILLKKEQ